MHCDTLVALKNIVQVKIPMIWTARRSVEPESNWCFYDICLKSILFSRFRHFLETTLCLFKKNRSGMNNYKKKGKT